MSADKLGEKKEKCNQNSYYHRGGKSILSESWGIRTDKML